MVNTWKNHFKLNKTILLLFLCISISAFADDQNWTKNSISVKRLNGISFRLANEIKYRSWDWNDGVFTKNWAFGVGKKLGNGFSISFNYKQELTRSSTGNSALERAQNFDISWKRGLSNRSAFDLRLRTEIRKYDNGRKPDHYRFRFRFRFTAHRSILGHPVEPYLAIEPFYDTTSDSFSKYRFSTGLMVPIIRHTKLRLGYLMEDARKGSTHHVFSTGISLSF